jgi:hypothetical protein
MITDAGDRPTPLNPWHPRSSYTRRSTRHDAVVTTELTPELAATIKEAFDRRDRANMQPTIDFFDQLLTEHPDNPYVLYEVGGSYDTDGQEEKAIGYYERALPGLSGETRRKCLL